MMEKKMKSRAMAFVAVAGMLVLTVACATTHVSRSRITKQLNVNGQNVSTSLTLPGGGKMELDRNVAISSEKVSDTLKMKDLEGNDMFVMKAVRDELSGEDVAFDVLDAAVITARFTNVAERGGKIDIRFDIGVPTGLQHSSVQLRFQPKMFVLEDTIMLEPVIVTGEDYRKTQLKGYEQYDRFLSKIVSDTSYFIDMRQLEIFIHRNMPDIYAMKSDSTVVSDESFNSLFGVTEQEAIDHYTYKAAKKRNEQRKASKEKKRAQYIKSPIVTDGIRLDTILHNAGSEAFTYEYVQSVETKPQLRKIMVTVGGGIYEQEAKIYDLPYSDTLTFYVSSISSFVELSERYLTKVIERRISANNKYDIFFEVNKSKVDLELGENREEMGRVRDNIRDLLLNSVFDLDSVIVISSSSPEGALATNIKLSEKRSEAIAEYVSKMMDHLRDSISYEKGFSVDEEGNIVHDDEVEIPIISRWIPENWKLLDSLVMRDETLTEEQREEYFKTASITDLDARERALKKEPGFWNHVKTDYLDQLRITRFKFFLHRKGMEQEVVYTTELDSAYMKGVQAIKDRDYQTAIAYLSPYQDYNTAVAYVSLDRNRSALQILEELEHTAPVNYMLAIIYYRLGDDRSAVECYLHSCEQDPSYVFRGNLDPEISSLIKTYGLHKENDEIAY